MRMETFIRKCLRLKAHKVLEVREGAEGVVVEVSDVERLQRQAAQVRGLVVEAG